MKKFYENVKKLDRLKALEAPTEPDLNEVLEIVRDDEALESYFYAENELSPRPTAGWVRLLAEAGEFEVLGSPEGSNKLVPRLKARYLAESAKTVPEEVLKVTGSIRPKDEWIQGAFIDAIKNMPDGYIEKGDWIFWEFFRSSQKGLWFYAGHHVADLMVRMVNMNLYKAFGMARVLLELKASEEDSYFRKATSDFQNYVYEEIVKAYLEKICPRYPLRAVRLLLELLADYLESARKEDTPETRDFLYLAVKDLAANDPIERDYLAILIWGICEAGKIAVDEEPDRLSGLFQAIRDRGEGIFRRIELYLLRFVDEEAFEERINELIATRELFDQTYVELEYIRLLRDRFGCLTKDTINVYESWIREIHLEGEGKERYCNWFVETNGRECTAADMENYENGMRAQKLYDVREVLPELYREVSEKSGWSEETIRPWRPGEVRSWHESENTPKTKDELLQMDVDDVLAFVSDPENYKATGHERTPSSPKDGLAYEFQRAIKEKPIDYVNASIDTIIGLEEAFLSKYFYGIWDAVRERKVEGFDWDRYFEIAGATVNKYAPSGQAQRPLDPLVHSLEGCFGGHNQIEYTFQRLEAIYAIVDSLLEFKEDKDISEDSDPVQIRCNSVTGEALDRCVSLGIVCRRDFEREWQEGFKDKIRSAFDRVLNEIRTPWTCCTFGTDFARIYWLDREWVEENIETILSDELWDIVWSTYLEWGRPSKELFAFLAGRGIYSRAIDELRTVSRDETEAESGDKLEEKLGNHLVIAYFNGWLENGLEQVYEDFLAKAPDSLLGHTSRFFTTGFKSLSEDPDKQKNHEAIARLRGYWETRLDSISSQPKEHKAEAQGLASWINDSPFENRDSLHLLKRTLILTNGQLGRRGDVGRSINALSRVAEVDRLTALQCIRLIVTNQDVEIYDSLFADALNKLLEEIASEEVTSIDIVREAIDLVDCLGRLRMYRYAAHYDRLHQKLQALAKN